VFEKYFRAHSGTSRDAGGIGVGLYVAREIIRQHGGRIWFESSENHGSVFYIEMPTDEATNVEAT
jgi:signal transduction histidine kinase